MARTAAVTRRLNHSVFGNADNEMVRRTIRRRASSLTLFRHAGHEQRQSMNGASCLPLALMQSARSPSCAKSMRRRWRCCANSKRVGQRAASHRPDGPRGAGSHPNDCLRGRLRRWGRSHVSHSRGTHSGGRRGPSRVRKDARRGGPRINSERRNALVIAMQIQGLYSQVDDSFRLMKKRGVRPAYDGRLAPSPPPPGRSALLREATYRDSN